MGGTWQIKEVPSQKMILYTEKQLRESYKNYIGSLNQARIQAGKRKKIYIPIPTLEEFRKIYEEYYSGVHISNE